MRLRVMIYDPETIRGLFPLLVRQPGLHYLDSAATSQIVESALDAMIEQETTWRANVQRGTYALAEAATLRYENARESVRRFLNAGAAREVIFTAGATASINLFAQSFGARLGPGDEVLVSEAEHHSNLVPWQMLQDRIGIIVRTLPVTGDGRVALADLSNMISPRCRLIAMTHCSNVTGAITDLASVVRAARAVGASVFVDGAQYVQHGPVDVRALGIDAYAFSGHKCFGPSAVGVLWVREPLLESLPPCIGGGGMVGQVTLSRSTFAEIPRRFEAGTPPIAAAVGLGAAMDWMMSLPWGAIRERERQLTDRLLCALSTMRDVQLLGPHDTNERISIVSFNLKGIHPHDLAYVLDEFGLCLRGGTHCAMPLHTALGADSSIRASFALYNSENDIDCLLDGLDRARKVLQ